MNKFYQLIHPGAPSGVLSKKPKRRKQDKVALSEEMYAVVFFPKLNFMGPAQVDFYGVRTTLAKSPEAAKVLFMDRIARGEKWEVYQDAGHRIRKIKISDLGDADV